MNNRGVNNSARMQSCVEVTPNMRSATVENLQERTDVEPTSPMDGRVLHEALIPSKAPPAKVSEKKLEATRDLGLFRWTQYLQTSDVNGTVYFDFGNGEASPK